MPRDLMKEYVDEAVAEGQALGDEIVLQTVVDVRVSLDNVEVEVRCPDTGAEYTLRIEGWHLKLSLV